LGVKQRSGKAMHQSVWINGISNDTIDIRDRGLAYGDGVFETIKVHNGRAQMLDQHFSRMRAGAARLGFAAEAVDLFQTELSAVSLPERGVLKLTLTRGAGGRGYSYATCTDSTRIIMLAPMPEYAGQADNGISVRLCETRLGINPTLAGIKHLNRLEQVLARNEWDDASIHEGIVCDAEGYLAEGTMSNLFWVTAGIIYTPDLAGCGVSGIIRDYLLKRFESVGYQVLQGRFCPDVLDAADEIFVCNSLIDVWPVKRFAGNDYQIGSVAREAQVMLQQEYNA